MSGKSVICGTVGSVTFASSWCRFRRIKSMTDVKTGDVIFPSLFPSLPVA